MGGIVIAVIIILGRLIFGSPLIQRVRESFANAPPALINKSTECPKGSVMYMYGGQAYCCSGTINGNADTAKRSCRPIQGRDAETTFCTLGSSQSSIPNCLTLRAGLMQAEAETLCPSSLATFVQDAGQPGQCCGAPGGNSALTSCAAGATTCNVASGSVDADPFKNPGFCQFLKAQEDDGKCPSTFTPIVVPRADGTTVYGCTNSATNCYLPATLTRLRSFGHDTSGLVPCAAS